MDNLTVTKLIEFEDKTVEAYFRDMLGASPVLDHAPWDDFPIKSYCGILAMKIIDQARHLLEVCSETNTKNQIRAAVQYEIEVIFFG